jgi:hypothetical protein
LWVTLGGMGLRRTILVAGLGAALAYFLDPVSGKERRERLQQTLDEAMRKGPGTLGTSWRGTEPTPVVTEPAPEKPVATK